MRKTIEPGTYLARAQAWAWDTTKDGKPYLTVNLDVDGTTVRGRLYFDTDRTDANGRTSAERSMEVLRAMGLRTNLRALVTGATTDSPLLTGAQVHHGLIASGDQFISSAVGSAALQSALRDAGHEVLAVEMEGAAVAQVCADYGVPFAAMRTISDRADDTAHIDFPRFVTEVASRYALAIVNALLQKLPVR